MTSTEDSHHRDPVPPSWQHQSMLYLLGELDAEQVKWVEDQLATSPQLGEDLLRQAELIAGLAELPPAQAVVPVANRDGRRIHWTPVAAVAAVAACLAFLILGLSSPSGGSDSDAGRSTASFRQFQTGPSEDLLIARAWASHPLSAIEAPEFVESDVDEADQVTADENPLESESALSWMFVAISANTEALEPGVANDG